MGLREPCIIRDLAVRKKKNARQQGNEILKILPITGGIDFVDPFFGLPATANPNTNEKHNRTVSYARIAGEVGLMQIMPATAELLGFTGSPE
jgi:hypothetical protein